MQNIGMSACAEAEAHGWYFGVEYSNPELLRGAQDAPVDEFPRLGDFCGPKHEPAALTVQDVVAILEDAIKDANAEADKINIFDDYRAKYRDRLRFHAGELRKIVDRILKG